MRPAVSAKQTTAPSLTAFELQERGGKWVALPPSAVNVSADASLGLALDCPVAGGVVTAVRYAWSSIPSGLLLYGGVGSNPTPAANFFAQYDDT